MQSLIGEKAKIFLEHVFAELEKNQVQIKPHWDIDHLCYRVETIERYFVLKKEFSKISTLLTESIVNGRPIATFKLDRPLHFRQWQIDIIELPAPKSGKIVTEGFEHIEVVVDESLEYLSNQYNHIKQDKNGLVKNFNKELELCLGASNIKFHNLSLESVVKLELNSTVWKSIQYSMALDVLKAYKPLIAGTFPLGIANLKSDVDLIIQTNDFQQVIELASARWGQNGGFVFYKMKIDEQDSLVVNFTYDNVAFEVFAQNIEPVKQKAYQHFLIEEKLLKYKGPEFKEKILRIRSKGTKTEPAFAQALNLDGNPYEQLLKLQTKSIKDL